MDAALQYFQHLFSTFDSRNDAKLISLKNQMLFYYSNISKTSDQRLVNDFLLLLNEVCSSESLGSKRKEILLDLVFSCSKDQLKYIDNALKDEKTSLIELLSSNLDQEDLTFLSFLLLSDAELDESLLSAILESPQPLVRYLLLELIGTRSNERIKMLWKDHEAEMHQLCSELDPDCCSLVYAFKEEDDDDDDLSIDDDDDDDDQSDLSLDKKVLDLLDDIGDEDVRDSFFYCLASIPSDQRKQVTKACEKSNRRFYGTISDNFSKDCYEILRIFLKGIEETFIARFLRLEDPNTDYMYCLIASASPNILGMIRKERETSIRSQMFDLSQNVSGLNVFLEKTTECCVNEEETEKLISSGTGSFHSLHTTIGSFFYHEADTISDDYYESDEDYEEEQKGQERKEEDMYEDLLSSPDCFDKGLDLLVYHLSQIIQPSTSSTSMPNLEPSRNLSEAMNIIHEYSNDYKPTCDNRINEISTELTHLLQYIGNRRKEEEMIQSSQKLLALCHELLKDVRLINIRKMMIMYKRIRDEESDEIGQTDEHVKDKDIVMLVGGTGVGKTTTVQFLAGSNITEEWNDRNDYMRIDTSNLPSELRKKIKNFVTSERGASETRVVRAIDIPLSGEELLTLCDTPGIQDTEGGEMDIINGQLVLKALQSARSVKFLFFLCSLNAGTKFQGLRLLPKTLLQFIPSINQDTLRSIGYVFTRYKEESRTRITNQVGEVQQNLNSQERSDKNYMAILNDMKNKTYPEAMIIEPDKPETRRNLIEMINNIQPLISSEVEFRNFASFESISLLKQQLHLHKEFIFNKINEIIKDDEDDDDYNQEERKREESSSEVQRQSSYIKDQKLIIMKIKEIKFLYECLGFEEAKFLYEDIIGRLRNVYRSYAKKCERLISVSLSLENHHVDMFVSELNRSLTKVAKYEYIRSNFFDNMVSYSDLMGRVSTTMSNIIYEIKTLTYKGGILGLSSASSRLNKLRIFKDCFCNTQADNDLIERKISILKNYRNYLLLLDIDFTEAMILSAIEREQERLGSTEARGFEKDCMEIIEDARASLYLKKLKGNSESYIKTLYRLRALHYLKQSYRIAQYEAVQDQSFIVDLIKECFGDINVSFEEEDDMLDFTSMDDVLECKEEDQSVVSDLSLMKKIKRMLLSYYLDSQNVLLIWESMMWVWFKEYFESRDQPIDLLIEKMNTCKYFKDNFTLFFGNLTEESYTTSRGIVSSGLVSWSTFMMNSFDYALSTDIVPGLSEDTLENRLARLSTIDMKKVSFMMNQYRRLCQQDVVNINFIEVQDIIEQIQEVLDRVDQLFEATHSIVESIYARSKQDTLTRSLPIVRSQDDIINIVRLICVELRFTEKLTAIETNRDLLLQTLRSYVEALAKLSSSSIHEMLSESSKGSYKHVSINKTAVKDAILGLAASTGYDRRIYRDELNDLFALLKEFSSIFNERLTSYQWNIELLHEVPSHFIDMIKDLHELSEIEVIVLDKFGNQDVDDEESEKQEEFKQDLNDSVSTISDFHQDESDTEETDLSSDFMPSRDLTLKESLRLFKESFYDMLVVLDGECFGYRDVSSYKDYTKMANISLSKGWLSKMNGIFKKNTIDQLERIFSQWNELTDAFLTTIDEEMSSYSNLMMSLLQPTAEVSDDDLVVCVSKFVNRVKRLDDMHRTFTKIFEGSLVNLDSFLCTNKVYDMYNRYICSSKVEDILVQEDESIPFARSYLLQLKNCVDSCANHFASIDRLHVYKALACEMKKVDGLISRKYGSYEDIENQIIIAIEHFITDEIEKMKMHATNLDIQVLLSEYDSFILSFPNEQVEVLHLCNLSLQKKLDSTEDEKKEVEASDLRSILSFIKTFTDYRIYFYDETYSFFTEKMNQVDHSSSTNLKEEYEALRRKVSEFEDFIASLVNDQITKLYVLIEEGDLYQAFSSIILLDSIMNAIEKGVDCLSPCLQNTKTEVQDISNTLWDTFEQHKGKLIKLRLSDLDTKGGISIVNFYENLEYIRKKYSENDLNEDLVKELNHIKRKLKVDHEGDREELMRFLKIFDNNLEDDYQNIKLLNQKIKDLERKYKNIRGTNSKNRKMNVRRQIEETKSSLDHVLTSLASYSISLKVSEKQYASLRNFLKELQKLSNDESMKSIFDEHAQEVYNHLSTSVKKAILFFTQNHSISIRKNTIKRIPSIEDDDNDDRQRNYDDKNHDENDDEDTFYEEKEYDLDDEDTFYEEKEYELDGLDDEMYHVDSMTYDLVEDLKTSEEFIRLIERLEKNFFCEDIIKGYEQYFTKLKNMIKQQDNELIDSINRIASNRNFVDSLQTLVNNLKEDIEDMSKTNSIIETYYDTIMNHMKNELKKYTSRVEEVDLDTILSFVESIWPSWYAFAFEIVPTYSQKDHSKLRESKQHEIRGRMRSDRHTSRSTRRNQPKTKESEGFFGKIGNMISGLMYSDTKEEEKKDQGTDEGETDVTLEYKRSCSFIDESKVRGFTETMFKLIYKPFKHTKDSILTEVSINSVRALEVVVKYVPLCNHLYSIKCDYEQTNEEETSKNHLYLYLVLYIEGSSTIDESLNTLIVRFGSKINMMREKVRQFLLLKQQEVTKAIASRDFSNLITLLEANERYDDILSRVWESPFVGLGQDGRTWRSYTDVQEELRSDIESIKQSLKSKLYLSESTKAFSNDASDRKEYYNKLYKDYRSYRNIFSLIRNNNANTRILGVNLQEGMDETINTFKRNVSEFESSTLQNLASLPTEDQDIYYQIQIAIDTLVTISSIFESTDIGSDASGMIKTVDTRMKNKLNHICEEASRLRDPVDIIDQLCMLQMLLILVPRYEGEVKSVLDRILDELVKRRKTITISELCSQIQDIRTEGLKTYGLMLRNDHPIFKRFITEQRNEATSKIDISTVINNLREGATKGYSVIREGDKTKDETTLSRTILSNTNLNADTLRHYYDLFAADPEEKKDDDLESKEEEHSGSGLYWKLVSEGFIDTKSKLEEIVNLARNLTDDRHLTYKDRVLTLISYVFAYWTLDDYEKRQKDDIGTDTVGKNTLLQPHSAQVISIFRLLGMDVNCRTNRADRILQNHIVQIGTGEGKSVTLAVTSCILALLGYEVDCACYSSYLSERDYQAFFSLFRAFSVQDYITYGTFDALSEKMINSDGEIREMVLDMIENGEVSTQESNQSSRSKIILIDEVDVFFSKEVYGKKYIPVTKVHHPAISSLIQYIWDHRNDTPKASLAMMKASSVYQDCLNEFPDWEDLLEQVLKGLLADVQSFDNPSYEVSTDPIDGKVKVGYKDHHNISFSTFYRYKTVFAYINAVEERQIDRETAEEQMAMILVSGSFSYAEIPKRYDFIMGVTGTLSTLSDPEMRLLKNSYSITKFTYMPSMFSKQNAAYGTTSAQYNSICTNEDFFHTLRNAIKFWMENWVGDNDNDKSKSEESNTLDQGREGSSTPYKRNGAVLVFLESKEVLNEFSEHLESDHSFRINDRAADIYKLHEETPTDDKNRLIKTAAQAGKITLCTRDFGRGTDFICYDDRLNENGGVHVIQAFVASNLAEQTQVMGRTARQNNKGSYSLVLNHGHLDCIQMTQQDIESIGSDYYRKIDKFRSEFFAKQYQKVLKEIEDVFSEHEKAIEFVSHLQNSHQPECLRYLVEMNYAHYYEQTPSRTICLMDATGSMHSTLEGAKSKVNEMFRRVYDIFHEQSYQGGFEMQFVAYRNYNVDARSIVQHSGWESDAIKLENFMKDVGPNGGWGNEAIEAGFAYVNHLIDKGDKISQVILIGDMPPNTREEVTYKRGHKLGKGEGYWQESKESYLLTPTYYEDELQKIVDRGIPVHAFYVKESAKNSFEDIAGRSNGKSDFLDVDSPEGAENLTNVVSIRILDQAGGEDFVQKYKEKFIRGHA